MGDGQAAVVRRLSRLGVAAEPLGVGRQSRLGGGWAAESGTAEPLGRRMTYLKCGG